MKRIKTDKKLQLTKQTLRTLTTETLAQVAGGASLHLYSCADSNTGSCIGPPKRPVKA